jgi:hypothetical protein
MQSVVFCITPKKITYWSDELTSLNGSASILVTPLVTPLEQQKNFSIIIQLIRLNCRFRVWAPLLQTNPSL